MRIIWTIAIREYRQYFASPVAYMITFVILLVIGILFFLNIDAALFQPQFVPGVEIVLAPLATLLMLSTPVVTSRLVAEERRAGTIELLLTAPVRDSELIIGKWLGVWMFMITIIAITIIYPLMLNQFVSPGIDQGPVITGYLGLVLLASAMTAIGVGISALFNNQIASFATTLGVMIFLWWIIGPISNAMGLAGAGSQWVAYLNLNEHYYSNFFRGIFDLRDVVFYLSMTALGLFLGTMSLEGRRWA